MRLIDADVLDRMGYVLTRTYQQDKETMVYETKKLSDVPSAQPRKTGKWMPVSDETQTWHYCSECHYQQYEKTKFCPNCGAKMEVEHE